ncbi:hypothetical protein AND_007545 [Anopheles darlingi]|uniref:Uncharacterized protein n=1 Tax=Anopheles darlingi TaxID=43151 RepID=W5JA03_ANODA|nr:hypothetical protein AND_007545 [Anopheles darlingi]
MPKEPVTEVVEKKSIDVVGDKISEEVDVGTGAAVELADGITIADAAEEAIIDDIGVKQDDIVHKTIDRRAKSDQKALETQRTGNEATKMERRTKAKATVTKVNLGKQTPAEFSKRSTKTTDNRLGSVTISKSTESSITAVGRSSIITSRSSTTTRTHGYMQSTLSRDQKVLRPLNLIDSTQSSPSKSSYRSTAVSSAGLPAQQTASSSVEKKRRSNTQISSRSASREQPVPSKSVSSPLTPSIKKSDVIDSKTVSTKATTTRVTSATISSSRSVQYTSTSSSQRLSRAPTRKDSVKGGQKEALAAVIKKADKEQANKATKSTVLPAALKTSKDRVNKSLIPVMVPMSKRDSSTSPSKLTQAKQKRDTSTPRIVKASPEKVAPIRESTVVQIISKSAPRITSTIRHGGGSGKDDAMRCKSAMHYSHYKDAVTFDHAEIPSSLPSSPSRLNKSSSNSTNVLTSEVFTRTIDASKSIEVIYKQPSTSHELYRKASEYGRYTDSDVHFIETTDSSLSDSIALPSSSSEQESDPVDQNHKQSGSLGSPKQTSSSSAVTTMTTMTRKTNSQGPTQHARPSKARSAYTGQRARTHSPTEPQYRMSDIWSRTDPPASSQELPDTSDDSDLCHYRYQQAHQQQQQAQPHFHLQQQQQQYQLQQQQQRQQAAAMSGIADRRLTTSLDGIVLESSISPILDFRASTPPRLKGEYSMADIPIISITKECSDDEELSTSSASRKPNIEDEHTDVEDLMMEPGQRGKEGSQAASPTAPSPTALTLLEALQSSMNGAVTDVEDCSDTSDEEDADRDKSAREVDISLDNFLDQGYVDETTKSNGTGTGTKPKVLTRSSSKAIESYSGSTASLKVCVDTSAALTDCEDCDASDEENIASTIPDCPEDILMRGDEDNGMVDIHNAVRRRQEKHLPRAEPVQTNSSDSDEPECKVVRHRKPHRRGVVDNTSDCENIMVSDDESGACARPHPDAVFEAEEITLEDSDHDQNDQSTVYPEINISFVTDEANNEVSTGKKKVNSSRPSSLTITQANPDDAVTDVENLDSSDSETEHPQLGKRLMPRAVARGSKSGAVTDVEDFNTSGEEDNEDGTARLEAGGGEDHSFLPSPTREISIMRGDGSGEQTANVMPLNQPCLLVKTPELEQVLTDFEELDMNDDEKLYDDTQYTIDELPEVDNDNVYSSDNNPKVLRQEHTSDRAHEPVTDTEDLFFDRAQGKGCGASVGFASNELRRRRKPKGAGTAIGGASVQSYKGKTFLDTKTTANDDEGPATTDVEDLYLSDEDEGISTAKQRSQQHRRATIQVPQHNEAAKTDIEYLSGDEYVSERTAPSPTVHPEGFQNTTVRSRERTGGLLGGNPQDLLLFENTPIIRKISPTPDAGNCNTDCEEIQDASSDADEQTMLGVRDGDSYSRAQTATPLELRRALDESGSCEIHDALVGPPRRMYEAEMMGGDAHSCQDRNTDVEFVDGDEPAAEAN